MEQAELEQAVGVDPWPSLAGQNEPDHGRPEGMFGHGLFHPAQKMKPSAGGVGQLTHFEKKPSPVFVHSVWWKKITQPENYLQKVMKNT